VTVPSDAELLAEAAEASGDGGGAANSTAWLGCIIANHSLMAGAVVEVVDGVEDAEQCCRLCREASGGACNAWNWCQEQGGCRCGLRLQGGSAPQCASPSAQHAGCPGAAGCRQSMRTGRGCCHMAYWCADLCPAKCAPLYLYYCCSYKDNDIEVLLQPFQCEQGLLLCEVVLQCLPACQCSSRWWQPG